MPVCWRCERMAATSEMVRSRKASEKQLWLCKDRPSCSRRVSARRPQQLRLG